MKIKIGEGERYLGNAKYKPEGNVTLYAIWESNVVTITLNSNNGTGTKTEVTVTKGKETKLSENPFTRKGYVFVEWNSKADGSGTKYQEGAMVKLEENIELYAIWKTYIPSTAETTPFLPEGASIDEEHNSLENGLVIKDAQNNEWVWIEVPRTTNVYKTAGLAIKDFTEEEYTKIEEDLKTYTSDYRGSYTDTWYSEAQHGFKSAEVYNNHKKSMLKSVYENGGFYIGRYEVGIENARTASSTNLPSPMIQRDNIPIFILHVVKRKH